MSTARLAITLVLGGFFFALAAASVLELLCYAGFFSSCSGSIFHPFALLIFGVGGVVISAISVGVYLVASRAPWYRAWYMPLIFLGVGVLAPKLYLVLTGSDFELVSILDVVFGAGSISAWVAVFVLWRRRPNSGAQPTPQAGAADAGR
jgi:hypothetical protein